MANGTVGIGLTIGAVTKSSVGSALTSTRRALDGLTRNTRALEKAQLRVGRTMKSGLLSQQANYDRLGRAMARVRGAHEKLTAAAARSNAAITAGQQSWGKLATTAMAAWGTAKTVMATAGQSAEFADVLRDTRIKGRLSAGQETALGASIRGNVAGTNQSRADLAAGAHQLIMGGASFEEVQSQIGLMGDVMTALRTSGEETTGAMLALRDMGATDRDGMQGGLERLIAIGERGQFTPDMMVRAFAQLGDTIKTAGLKGDTAIAELAAGLQVAEGTMGATGAQAGLQSWLSGLNDPKVAAAYERAGVDYKTSMAKLQKSGMSQYQASLELAGAFVRDSLSAKDQQALLNGDEDGRISAMLSEMGLGEVFKDANAARFALSIHRNKEAYQGMTGATGAGSLTALADLRKDSPVEQMKALQLQASELAVQIGNALLPALLGVVNTLSPMVAGISAFAQANPGAVQAIGALVAGIVAWRVASVAGIFAFRQTMIVVTQGAKAFRILRAGVAIAQAQMALFGSGAALAGGTLGGKLGKSIKLVGNLFKWLGRLFMTNPIGIAIMAIAGAAYLVIQYWEPIKEFFGKLWDSVTGIFSAAWDGIGSLLSGAWNGIKGVAESVWGALTGFYGGLWDGITGIFSAAWDGIGSLLSGAWNGIKGVAESVWGALTGFYGGLWDGIKSIFDGGIADIAKTILDWSPLGLFQKGFSAVMSWFGVDLPESFTEFGGNIVSGVISGVTGALTAAKEAVVGFGENIKGWFSSVLGINSPSRVFMGLGANVSQGAALGISGSQSLVRDAALGLAAATAVTLATPAFAAPEAPAGFQAGGTHASGIVIHFSPTIHVQGADDTKGVEQALRQARDDLRRELVQLLREEQARAQRRTMGNIGER